MTEQEFNTELEKIAKEAWDKARELVFKAQTDEGMDWQTDKPVSFHGGMYYKSCDSLAELAGWIYDRLDGKTRMDKKSMTKKIRKALGYTYF